MKPLPKIYGYKIPSFVCGLMQDHGYEIENIDHFREIHKCSMFFEELIISSKKFEVFKKIITKYKPIQITIVINHIFKVPKNHLDQLDQLANLIKINLIVHGTILGEYKNLNVYELNLSEQQLGHHDLYVAGKILKQNINIKYDFMAVVNLKKNQYRKKIFDYLNSTNIFQNSKIQANDPKQFEIFQNKSKKLFEYLQNYKAGKSLHTAYGNTMTLPPFHLYEKCFCEIVVESGNLDAGDISEKTYRPVLLGKPIVWLGNNLMFKKLQKDGYKFYDNNFYDNWFQLALEKDKLQHLYNFLDHIKQSNQAKIQMEKIAKENYINFWHTRKIDIPYQNYKMLKQCFGDSLHEVAYNYCDF